MKRTTIENIVEFNRFAINQKTFISCNFFFTGIMHRWILPAHVEFFNLQTNTKSTSIKHTLLHAIEVMSWNTIRLNEYCTAENKEIHERGRLTEKRENAKKFLVDLAEKGRAWHRQRSSLHTVLGPIIMGPS